MMFELKQYQERAVNQLLSSFKLMLTRSETKKICVFQSPTGSGKTLMTAKFISELILENPRENFCFLWISIGKGELHLQSKKSLEKVFNGYPIVNILENEFHGDRTHIGQNEVLVVNWEKIRSKDKDGVWKNILMRDGEVINFREILSNTRKQRKIILIIDESHYGASAERANELRDEIDADIVLEMSATPKFEPKNSDIQTGQAGYVCVEPQEVIAEGMIKKEIIINDAIEKIADNEIDSQELVLTAALNKRKEIKNAYEELGLSINPLVLVQIPNSTDGDLKKQEVIDFLYRNEITEKRDGVGNGKLAIYINNYPISENYKWIADPTNEIEFLIFKQAIDTGWDCPRSHILVKLRESKSETFEIQTVGRILRMPEQRHYDIEILNTGYIFTNVQSIIIKKEDYNPNIIKHLKSTSKTSIVEHGLYGYYKSRSDYGDIGSSFIPVFEEIASEYFKVELGAHFEDNLKKMEDHKVVFNTDDFQQSIITDFQIQSSKFDEITGQISSEHSVKLTISGSDLILLFESFLRGHMGYFKNVKRSLPTIKQAIYVWFRKYIGSKNWSEPTLTIQKLILADGNREIFSEVLTTAISKYEGIRKEEVLKKIAESEQFYEYDLPGEIFHSQHTEKIFPKQKYIFDPCYLDIGHSNPEQLFEETIDQMVDVKWWWKNGESRRDYFSVKYEYPDNTPHAFFPDYFVKLRNNQLLIIEVKSSTDPDGLTVTPVKMKALNDFLTNTKTVKNVSCGIVLAKGKKLLAHRGDFYDWNKTISGDWSEWLPIEKFINGDLNFNRA